MSDLFEDTIIGLLQAVSIEKGYIPMEKIPNLPAETYRVADSFVNSYISKYKTEV